MRKYIVTKLSQGILIILAVSILVFSLLFMMPGDPVEILSGERVTVERMNEIRAQMGLDKPIYEQYINWLKKAIKMDFGTSISTKIPVSESLKNRIPITIRVSGIALILQILIAIPLGLLAAYKKDSVLDRMLMAISSFLQSIPNFWLAMLLILFFGSFLQWLPINGLETWKHYVLPALSIALGGMASILRMVKAEVLDVFREKYVQTAYAKGLKKRTVVIKHVLRNSLVLVTVMVFLSLPWIVSGSVIIENIFIIPGMGSFLTKSIAAQDFPVVQACVLIIATLTVLCNLISDIIAAMLDPRIRIEISGGIK